MIAKPIIECLENFVCYWGTHEVSGGGAYLRVTNVTRGHLITLHFFVILCSVSGLKKSACSSSGHVRLYGRPSGYLYWSPTVSALPHTGRLSAAAATASRPSNRQRGMVRVGSPRCPWTVIVDPGQRINVSLAALLPYPPGATVERTATTVPTGTAKISDLVSPELTRISHFSTSWRYLRPRGSLTTTSRSNWYI